MSKIKYKKHDFRPASLDMIEQANKIIVEYLEQGLDLTLRQLYYQFVARGLLPNTQRSYSKLGSLINDARLAGLVDWSALEDRTRNLQGTVHEVSPKNAVSYVAENYKIDKWDTQDYRVEVWVEKEALIGVFASVCDELDLDYFACRGFVSQSEMWRAACRLRRYEQRGQEPVILHFGDHDPSGIDMTRDIKDRFDMFGVGSLRVERCALNMDQVEEHSPPPNPAKATDSRFRTYQDKFGNESWELDALEPLLLRELVRDHVFEFQDVDVWAEAEAREEQERSQLQSVSDSWGKVLEAINE